MSVKLGIVNMLRQLSGEPSSGHDAFIYHIFSGNLHQHAGRMLPSSAAAASAAVVAIVTAYPLTCWLIQRVFFFVLRLIDMG